MFREVVLFALVAHCLASTLGSRRHYKGSDCQLSVSDYADSGFPLLLAPGSSHVVYPDSGLTITVADGASLDLACPGSTLAGSNKDTGSITCRGGSLALEGRHMGAQKAPRCTGHAFHTGRYTGATCEQGKRQAEVGFLLSDGRFVRQIEVCFDPDTKNNLYSHHTETKALASEAHKIPRPFFVEDGFYKDLGTSISKLYSRTVQRRTINELVGLPASSKKYVHDTDYLYLSRGHMSPKAAFVYPAQQNATFHYVNTAPQWQTFNGGNWNAAETDTRDYVQRNHVDLEVYTGAYGVATLPHEDTGKQVPLYLYAEGSKRAMAVPKLYWKVLYNAQTKAGVALVGANNPYLKEVGDSLVCKDVSSQLGWLSWEADDAQKGFSYACAVDDLRKTVTHIPALDVKKLLV